MGINYRQLIENQKIAVDFFQKKFITNRPISIEKKQKGPF